MGQYNRYILYMLLYSNEYFDMFRLIQVQIQQNKPKLKRSEPRLEDTVSILRRKYVVVSFCTSNL